MKFIFQALAYVLHNSARMILGVILLGVGIVGLFLPIVQGILLIGFGLTILGCKTPKEKIIAIVEKIKSWLKF